MQILKSTWFLETLNASLHLDTFKTSWLQNFILGFYVVVTLKLQISIYQKVWAYVAVIALWKEEQISSFFWRKILESFGLALFQNEI